MTPTCNRLSNETIFTMELPLWAIGNKKKSLHASQMAHIPEAYSCFCSMKRLGVLLLLPGWDASPSQVAPQHFVRFPCLLGSISAVFSSPVFDPPEKERGERGLNSRSAAGYRAYLSVHWYPFIPLGGERHCGSKVSCQLGKAWKNCRASTASAPVNFAIQVLCSTNWTMKSHIGSDIITWNIFHSLLHELDTLKNSILAEIERRILEYRFRVEKSLTKKSEQTLLWSWYTN